MFSKLYEVSTSASVLRTAIFTTGHFMIDVFVIALITGATIGVASTAALVGPAINGLWFFFIDKTWSTLHAKSETV